MKKIIIVALMLATVWGCKDNNPSVTWDQSKDTVDARIITIEGMVIDNDGYGNLDILGDSNKVDEFCAETDLDFLDIDHYIINGLFDVSFTVWKDQDVEIRLETINTSQQIKDEVLSRYNRVYPDHYIYSDTILSNSYLTYGSYSYSINANDIPLGAYLLKVIRKGGDNLCKPVIITTLNTN